MVVGPWDKRTLRKRCQACTRRRIKCEGGTPCVYCVKKNFTCTPQLAASKTRPVFVVQAPNIPGSKALSPVQDLHLTLFGNVPQDKSSQFIGHFFSTFLATNDFAAGPLDLETIISKFQESPSLYHAVVSVGALDISRRLPSSSRTEQKASRVGALTAYRTSINNFRAEIEDNRLLPNDACLWTTIFLGIFELMYDDSGKGWIKHMLYGTSKIIQLRGPESHLFGPGKSFFLTVRVFEICRSLLFSEPTFLSEPGWRSLMSQMREIDPSQHWHPKEELFDLMILCSDLSLRVWDMVKPNFECPPESVNKALLDLAFNGLCIRKALDDWYSTFLEWLSENSSPNPDLQATLAIIYYHAISIFLSGIFDYHSQFNQMRTPTLSQPLIETHVSAILSGTKDALNLTNLGGLLFLFPLRVVGARTTFLEQNAAIITMLREISKRSFVVADSISSDLDELWRLKGI